MSFKLGKRKHFRLASGLSSKEAEARRKVLAQLVTDLRPMNNQGHLEGICIRAGLAQENELVLILKLVAGLVRGEETALPTEASQTKASARLTFGEFADQLTSGELARNHRRKIKDIDQADNAGRLRKHVFPVVYDGRTLYDTPLDEFSEEHADHALNQDTLSEASLRHVAQVIHRVLSLAANPCKHIRVSPLPRGWLPSTNRAKAKSFLFPSEEEKLMGATEIPVVWRLFFGFAAREGTRRENVQHLRWNDLVLDGLGAGGRIEVDKMKNGQPGCWALDPSVAEALRRWRTICPSSSFVFPASALPRSTKKRAAEPIYVEHAAEMVRRGLRLASVTRAKLFEKSDHRLRFRDHDLRTTFVTLSLAMGRSEDWVILRTGHRSSKQLREYLVLQRSAEAHQLGWLQPLHEAIPELAALPPSTNLASPTAAPSAGASRWSSCQGPKMPFDHK